MTGSRRLPGWQARLDRAIRAHRRAAFAWGVHDCAILCADAETAITGHDPAAPYRGRYTTRAAGVKIVRRDGFEDHVAVFASRLEGVHPSRARQGDIALVDEGRALVLGVVAGGYIRTWLMPEGCEDVTEAKFGMLPMTSATKVFRVG